MRSLGIESLARADLFVENRNRGWRSTIAPADSHRRVHPMFNCLPQATHSDPAQPGRFVRARRVRIETLSQAARQHLEQSFMNPSNSQPRTGEGGHDTGPRSHSAEPGPAAATPRPARSRIGKVVPQERIEAAATSHCSGVSFSRHSPSVFGICMVINLLPIWSRGSARRYSSVRRICASTRARRGWPYLPSFRCVGGGEKTTLL